MKLLCFIKMIVKDIIEDAIKRMLEGHEQTVIYRVIEDNIPLISLFHYVPKSVDDTNDTERQHNRELLWCFKDGNQDDEQYPIVMEAVLDAFMDIICKLFDNDTRNLTLTFIPSSSKSTNHRRWSHFSRIIANALGCENGFKHLRPTKDSVPRHYIGRGRVRPLDVDEEFFEGKRVVLVDDLVNTGETMKDAIRQLRNAGAEVVCCLSVATT